MVEVSDHSACVDAWLQNAARDVSAQQLVGVFQQGFGALWRRAHRTLGHVTLTAIGDRVLYTATERYPWLSSVQIEATGIGCTDLLQGSAALESASLVEGVRFVLVEFLTVLGNLTANILTPALHAELSKVAAVASDLEQKSQDEPQNARRNREDAKS